MSVHDVYDEMNWLLSDDFSDWISYLRTQPKTDSAKELKAHFQQWCLENDQSKEVIVAGLGILSNWTPAQKWRFRGPGGWVDF